MDLGFVGLKVVRRDSGNRRVVHIASGPSRRVIRGLQGSCTVCPLAKHLQCAATEAGHFIHAEPAPPDGRPASSHALGRGTTQPDLTSPI